MVDENIEKALQIIGEFTKIDTCHVTLLDDSDKLSVWYEWNRESVKPTKEFFQNLPLDMTIWQNNPNKLLEPLMIHDLGHLNVSNTKLLKGLQNSGIESFLMIPMIHLGKVFGFISLSNSKQGSSWDKQTPTMLQAIAEIFVSKLVTKDLEIEKQKQEIQYQNLFNNMVNAFTYHKLILDDKDEPIDYLYLDVNPAFTTLTGKSREEVIGKKISEITPNFYEAMKNYLKKYYKVAIDGVNITYEHYSPSINKWFLVNSYCPEHGYFVNIFSDITKRKRAEEKLQQSEQWFHDVLNYSLDASYRNDLQNRKIIYLSPVFTKITGIPTEGLTYTEFLSRINLEDHNREKLHFYREIERTKSLKMPITMIYRYLCQDDVYRWMRDDFTVFLDETKKPLYSVGTLRDIHQQTEAEKKLKRSEMRFREVLDHSTDVIYRMDYQTKTFDYISPSIETLFGYSMTEISDFSFFDPFELCHPDDRHAVGRANDQLISVNSPQTTINLQYRVKLKNGIYRWIDENRTAIKNEENETIFILGVFRDITERLKMEEERLRADKIESIGLLAAGIAHDFNNILVTILGNANLLQMTEIDVEQEEILHDIEQGTYKATNLTKQLLTFAKGGAPIRKLEKIQPLIEDATKFVLSGSKCRSDIIFEDDLPLVYIDAGQINQVLTNLIINANHSMKDGGVIRISAEKLIIDEKHALPLQKGNYLYIEVQDKGIGIDPTQRENIFKPYFTTKTKGTGLGLATCYSIIKQHKGYINFLSEENVGSIFFFYLPVPLSTKPQISEKAQRSKGSNKSILLLDDDANIHKLLNRLFKKLSIKLDSVYDGKEILSKYKEKDLQGEKYNLVIMDLTIPGGIGGREAITHLKTYDPAVKVIVSSGYSNDPIMSDHEKYGFVDVLPKPFTIREIKNILEKHI